MGMINLSSNTKISPLILNVRLNRGKRGKRGKKTVILQRSFSMSLLERSEKDLVLPKRNSGSEAKRAAYSRGAIRARRNSGGATLLFKP